MRHTLEARSETSSRFSFRGGFPVGPLVMLLLMASASTPGFSGDFDLPPGHWWDEPVVIERVGLTDQQRETIRTLVYEHARRMIDDNAAVNRAELDLKESVSRGELDPKAVRAAFAAFQEARRQLETERFEMLLGVRMVLTAEQWDTMEELRRRYRERRLDGPAADRRPLRPGPQRPADRRPGGGR